MKSSFVRRALGGAKQRLRPAAYLAFLGLTAFAGCAAPTWNGKVAQWGTMRAVLQEGRTEGRVSLAEACREPHSFGVGALEGLTGEVLILDGVAWTARPDGPNRLHVRSGDADSQAAFLAGAPRREGTLGSMKLSAVAKALRAKLRG